MAVQKPCYSREELARRGDEIYGLQVEEGDRGKIVASIHENPK
jgi:hypothetical protein